MGCGRVGALGTVWFGASSGLAPRQSLSLPSVRLCPPAWSLCSQGTPLGTVVLSNRFLSSVEKLFSSCMQNQEVYNNSSAL